MNLFLTIKVNIKTVISDILFKKQQKESLTLFFALFSSSYKIITKYHNKTL